MNWQERIDEAVLNGGFSSQDYSLACNWPTCACGEQDPRIPRNTDGTPLDLALSSLGVSFASAVYEDDFDGAERILDAIEERAEKVLAELGY